MMPFRLFLCCFDENFHKGSKSIIYATSDYEVELEKNSGDCLPAILANSITILRFA